MRKAKKIKLIGLFLVIFIMVVSMAGCSGNSSGNIVRRARGMVLILQKKSCQYKRYSC